MERKNKVARWYIEVYGLENESVARILAEENVTVESYCIKVDNKFKEHHLWEVPYSLINKIQKNINCFGFDFKFKIFYCEGKDSIIKEVHLHKLKKKARAVRKIKEDLEKRKAP